MRRTPKIFHVLKFVLLGAIFLLALGFGVRELWNCLIPDLFHGPVVTFWQALGLCLLGKLIFGWHGGGGPGKWSQTKEQWRKKMQQRMEHMTPEEKEKMRQRFRSCMPNRYNRWNDWNEEQTKETDTQAKPETNI